MQKIGWEFTVVDKDIGFGVVTVENDEETVVIESAKMSASQGLIEVSWAFLNVHQSVPCSSFRVAL